MSKIKLLVEIDENKYRHITEMPNVYASEVCEVIRNGTPYNPSGDAISREALKGVIETYRPALIYNNKTDMKNRMVDYFLDEIDNAQVAEGPKYKWEFKKGNGYAKCPVCGHLTTCWSEEELKDYRYCYYCGTKLEKGDVE